MRLSVTIPLPIVAVITSIVVLLLWYALGIVITTIANTAVSVFSGG